MKTLLTAIIAIILFFEIATAQQQNNTNISSASYTESNLEVFSVNYDEAYHKLACYLDSGITYRYGGTTNKKLDCSAFVGKVFRDVFQINLPRTSRDQAVLGVIPDTLQLFDLVFFSKNRSVISHVGIYIGDNMFIHCSSSSGKVLISTLDDYKKTFMYGKRIISQIGSEFLFTKVKHSIPDEIIVKNDSTEEEINDSIKSDIEFSIDSLNIQYEKLTVYQEGVASYYGGKFHGRKTASGERFDKYDYTAAHKSLPFGTMVRVTNTSNQKSVIVKINDRGPYAKGRVIDLSEYAMKEIAGNDGLCQVTLQIID